MVYMAPHIYLHSWNHMTVFANEHSSMNVCLKDISHQNPYLEAPTGWYDGCFTLLCGQNRVLSGY